MYRKWIECSFILAALLISLISISSAAGLTANPDFYTGAKCGVDFPISAPGILANDVPVGTLTVVGITQFSGPGTIDVKSDGSFVYHPPQNIASGTVVYFYYTATNGIAVSNKALAKITVTCTCHGAAPDVNVCLGSVAITPEYLISKGAGCMGCRDVAPKIDISKIPAAPVAGQCYPYTVTCPSCAVATGHVCFNAPCTITSTPFTVCSGVTPTTDQIKASGKVTCSCDTDPAISDPIRVGDHWEYTITCQSQCGPATAIGRVNIDAPCDVSIDTAFPIANCADHALPTPTEVIANGGVRCGCGVTPDITNIQWIETPPEGNLWVGTYTATCKSLNGCESSDTGQFTSELCDKFNCLEWIAMMAMSVPTIAAIRIQAASIPTTPHPVMTTMHALWAMFALMEHALQVQHR